jgi:hypothetical protein
MNHSTSNGRVDIKSPNTCDLFNMYDKIPAHQCTTYRNALEGQWDTSSLSDAYFSKENIQHLQNKIRQGVYEESNGQYKIAEQDCDTLKIIMRSIYLQYSSNLPTNINEQIAALNKMVLNYCIPQVFSEAQGYMKYLSDASTMYTPMEPPVLAKENDKQLFLKSFF